MKIIDISKHQKTFVPSTAKAAGIDGVILRVAYGTTADKTALAWAAGCNIFSRVGAYGFATWHYKDKCNGNLDTARALMKEQVTKWIDLAKSIGITWWFGIDQELETGKQMGLSKGDNTTLLREAGEMLTAAGLHPCIYCSAAWDIAWIKTSAHELPYWFAYYYKAYAAEDFAAVPELADAGNTLYFRWMRTLYASHRLCGWQFGSTGHGIQYGAGSANLDRDIFYTDPEAVEYATAVPAEETPVLNGTAHTLTIGPMSDGDYKTIKALAEQLELTVKEV